MRSSIIYNTPMLVPSSVEDIERMVRDQVQESVHLDYKRSAAADPNKPVEIAKDVSSFANSDGGVVLYGVEEEKDKGIPVRIDDGIDPAHCSKERLEDIITSHITPRPDDVRIRALPLETGRVLYVIEIPKSFRGPHQASDKRYYKRHNFKSSPMEDYEISDVRNRRNRVLPLISFHEVTHGRILAAFEVANVSAVVAENVRFEFSTTLPWPRGTPYALANGIRRMPPAQKLRFPYHTYPEILAKDSQIPAEFAVTISYEHPDVGARISDEWHVNINPHRDSIGIQSEAERQAEDIIKELSGLNKTIDKLRSTLEPLCSLGGATGLDLSILTLRNLRRVLHDGEDPEPIPAAAYRPDLFAEVLGVDQEMAYRLYRTFDRAIRLDELKAIPGMTTELFERIQRCFVFNPEAETSPQESR